MKNTSLFRILCLLLTLTLLAGFASCASGSDEPQTTASAVTEAPAASDDPNADPAETEPPFPEADYGGQEFTVYFRDQKAAHYAAYYILPLEDSVDIIDESATRRNLMVEEKYHITFVPMETDSPGDTLKKDIGGGAVPYQLILDKRNTLGPLARQGLMTNWNNLNIDLTTDWWDANAAKQYSVAGKLFLMPNDVSVSNISGTRFFFWNKAVLEDFKLKSPYDYIAEDDWNLDSFFTLVKGVSAPNADGTVGIFGLLDEEGAVRNHMLTGVGVAKVEVDGDGNLVSKIGSDYAERTQSFLERITAITSDKTVCMNMTDAHAMDAANASQYSDKYNHGRGLFAEGHFLFTQTSMGSTKQFLDMAKGFGVAPNPKYDKDQKEYRHQMDNNAVIWGIPHDASQNLEMIANVVDYWAYVSKSTVMETFYELTMKSKRASDPTAASVFDTVKSSICYYATDLYGVDAVSSMISASVSGSVANAWKTYEKPIRLGLEKVVSDISKLD